MGAKIVSCDHIMPEGYFEFLCPGCKKHHCLPTKGPNAWVFNGDVEKPTFMPSILARTPSGDKPDRVCHSYVTDGRIEFLPDSTHALAGKTVDLDDIPERRV